MVWVEGRDVSYTALIKNKSDECKPEAMDSEDPLFLLYTSGSTGKPKGVQHNQAGYILWAQMTMEWVFDVKEFPLTLWLEFLTGSRVLGFSVFSALCS